MPIIPFLIFFPFVMAFLMFVIRKNIVRRYVTYAGAAAVMLGVLALGVQYFMNGGGVHYYYSDAPHADIVVLCGEIGLMCLVVAKCFIYRRYWISLLSVLPLGLSLYTEHFAPGRNAAAHICVDHMSVLMCFIIGIIGPLIIIYAVGYMHGYHHHHTQYRDRRYYFFMLLFAFLGAMFGLVLSENLTWLSFFWEMTSICSFLLIGYTEEDIAITNSFRALWMNLFGGAMMTIGICYHTYMTGHVTLHQLIDGALQGSRICAIPVALIAVAALTKSAQLPFSPWLIGAMAAPTPSSALLHSATMVKAGVYILLRLSPAMYGTLTGTMISLIGGFTFLVTSLMAIAQSDGKKILAFSTISNLGLMVSCAGMGHEETVWAGVFLMIFHAISKSLLFQDVGATENSLHSRDVEDMHGLLYILPRLAIFMFIGIAGMFLAPFGMLIAKWSAFRASVDTGNIPMVFFIAFGSATTSFYWTKWMGKIISRSHMGTIKFRDITKPNEVFSLSIHAALMVLLCLLFPVLSGIFVDPLLQEMFGHSTAVLPPEIMIMLVALIIIVFAVPVFAYLYIKKQKRNVKLSYMNGINEGDNRCFTDAIGEPKRLWLSNYYFYNLIGQRKLMVPGQLCALVVLIVMMIMIIGGGLA